INAIAALPFVKYIGTQSIKARALNYDDVATHGASGFNAANGKELDGNGVTIGVGDEGSITTHIDFTGRVINRNASAPSVHSTEVSGTAGGAGIIDVKYHGLAPQVSIISNY